MPRMRRLKSDTTSDKAVEAMAERTLQPQQPILPKAEEFTDQKVVEDSNDLTEESSVEVLDKRIGRNRRKSPTGGQSDEQQTLLIADEKEIELKMKKRGGSRKNLSAPSLLLLQQQQEHVSMDLLEKQAEQTKHCEQPVDALPSEKREHKKRVRFSDNLQMSKAKNNSFATDSAKHNMESNVETTSSNDKEDDYMTLDKSNVGVEPKEPLPAGENNFELANETERSANPKKRVAADPDLNSFDNEERRKTLKRSKLAPRWYNQSYMLFLALRQHPERCLPRGALCRAAVEMDKKISKELNLPRVFLGKTPLNSASAKLTNNIDHYFVSFRPEGSKSMFFKLSYEPGDVKKAVEEYQKWCKKLIEHDWPYCFGVPKPEAIEMRKAENKLNQQQPINNSMFTDTDTVPKIAVRDKIQIGDGKENYSNAEKLKDNAEDATEPNTPTSQNGIIKNAISLVKTGFAPQSISGNDMEQSFSTEKTAVSLTGVNSITLASLAEEYNTFSKDNSREYAIVESTKGRAVDDVTNTLTEIERKKMKGDAIERHEKATTRIEGNTNGATTHQISNIPQSDKEEGSANALCNNIMNIDETEAVSVPSSSQSANFAGNVKSQLQSSSNTHGMGTETNIPLLTTTDSLTSTPLTTTTALPSSSADKPMNTEASNSLMKKNNASKDSKAMEEAPLYTLDELDLSNIPTSWRDIVYIAPSKIPGAGKGLFAKRKLPYNTPIGFYFGVPMTEDEFDAIKDRVGRASEYSIMYRRTVLDATDDNGEPVTDENSERFCPFHFMNETYEKNASILFVEGVVVNQVICWTRKEIEKDEELLVWYGSDVNRHWYDGSIIGPGDNSKYRNETISKDNTHRKRARTK
ncbi:hypothetical protein BDF20DRAFT_914349 [Mycotypha africana]|uniref:uncharacterized protein n=1 Tax=Mycotypha africana TaxID=64632 RepID=UPI00230192D2|nr:uncharacterized protein BDF20DRAFT_914349 [Mycotypha africana]KAI8975415.1 hypothetical protein BDF20DRAFT_914349 [Mycotypha africana]